jgi:hypothetical protein
MGRRQSAKKYLSQTSADLINKIAVEQAMACTTPNLDVEAMVSRVMTEAYRLGRAEEYATMRALMMDTLRAINAEWLADSEPWCHGS